MLSDVDGFYNTEKELLGVIDAIDSKLRKMAGGNGHRGRGGMYEKVKAAKISTSAGIPVIIANFKLDNVTARVLSGEEVGTLFLAEVKK